MVFSDTTTKLGLIQDAEIALFGDSGYGKISGDTNRLLQFTARINRRQDDFVRLALTLDGAWQYDDYNHVNGSGEADFPEATTSIESGRRDYRFNVSMLEIEKVMIYTTATSNDYQTLEPVDINDRLISPIAENNATDTGIPYKYDKKGDTVILYPTPNYNASLGLKIIFKRGPKYFVYTDTATAPGFASIFHNYLSRGAALDYAIDRGMPVATNLATQVAKIEQQIGAFFNRRILNERPNVTAEEINSI